MFKRNKARKSFEGCEVKKVVVWPGTWEFGRLACAKYPEGNVKYSGTTGGYPEERERFAQNLGCAACPFKDMKLMQYLDEVRPTDPQQAPQSAPNRVAELALVKLDIASNQ